MTSVRFSPSDIAFEVMKVISNPDTHGQVVRISKVMGVQHVIFEDQPPI
jgi:hypothetical protein